jgi:CubicO group peptidase (beta-lactamase class C family)
MTRVAVVVALLLLLSLGLIPLRAQPVGVVDDAAIRAILAQRIDVERRNVGIVVGVVEPAGQRLVAHGTFGVGDARPVDGESVFEIGSITKVFTSLVLADMAERGELRLDDPVAKYLPADVRVPGRDGRVITLEDLSTHTSALPRLPGNLKPANPANPYADYSVTQLYQFLSGYTLPRPIGAQFEYSNLGAGLLGHALSLKAGDDYESLVRQRVLSPLGMTDTAISLTSALQSRLARGHNQRREAVGNWDAAALAGAGALRSTGRDMMRFVAAFATGAQTALAAGAARMRTVERPGAVPGVFMALGWQVVKRPDREILWHGGMTGGYSAFAGYVPSRRVGVVVLSNMSGGVTGVDDIGLHLLDPRVPLTRPPVPRTRINLPAAGLAAFVGRYQLAPGFIATVTQEGDRLFLQPSNQPRHEIIAEGPRAFFTTIADAQFTFEVDASGRAVSMTLHQAGKSVTGKRIE